MALEDYGKRRGGESALPYTLAKSGMASKTAYELADGSIYAFATSRFRLAVFQPQNALIQVQYDAGTVTIEGAGLRELFEPLSEQRGEAVRLSREEERDGLEEGATWISAIKVDVGSGD